MREIIVKLASGKEKIIAYPVTFFDVNTKTFQKLIEDIKFGDIKEVTPEILIQVFGIMTDHDWQDYALTTDNRIESAMLKCARFVFEQIEDLNKLPVPQFFDIDGKSHRLPANLGKLTLGQNLHIRMVIDKKDIRSSVAFATAVYMQPILDGSKFDSTRVKHYEELILKMPITDVYPIGFFFLRQQKNFGKEPQTFWLPIKSILLKLLYSVRRFTKKPKLSY